MNEEPDQQRRPLVMGSSIEGKAVQVFDQNGVMTVNNGIEIPLDQRSHPRSYVRIYCNSSSHEGREVMITTVVPSFAHGRLTGFRSSDDDEIISTDGRIIDAAVLFGTATRPPSDDPTLDAARERKPIRCDLCGLAVPLRHERWLAVFGPIYEAGVRRVQLAALAAQIRQLYDDSGRKRTR